MIKNRLPELFFILVLAMSGLAIALDKNKVTSIEQAILRYGEVDIKAQQWAGQDEWLTSIKLSDYHPTLTGVMWVNKDLPMEKVLTELKEKGLISEIKTFNGCFNIRYVRGFPGVLSTHAFALSCDFNAGLLPLGKYRHSRNENSWSKAFIDVWKSNGFCWGGDFKVRPDPMHFGKSWECK